MLDSEIVAAEPSAITANFCAPELRPKFRDNIRVP